MNSVIVFFDGFLIAQLFIIWIHVFLNFNKLPKIIPVHFGFDGKPDNFGSKYFIFILPFFALILYFFLGRDVKEINHYPVKITLENKENQFFIAILAVKVIVSYVLFMFSAFQRHMINFSLNKTDKPLSFLKYLFGLFIIIGFFLIISNIYK